MLPVRFSTAATAFALLVALLPSESRATITIPPEQLAARAALVASWSPLQGEWAGRVAEPWKPGSALLVRVHLVGTGCVVSVRRNVSEQWATLGSQQVSALAKESVVFEIESVNPQFPGSYVGVLERKDENRSELILSRTVARPEVGAAVSFEELRSGALHRVPQSRGAAQ